MKGGLYGALPDLARLDGDGNLPFAVDFRSYYATFLERWWGIDSSAFLGTPHPPLGSSCKHINNINKCIDKLRKALPAGCHRL